MTRTKISRMTTSRGRARVLERPRHQGEGEVGEAYPGEVLIPTKRPGSKDKEPAVVPAAPEPEDTAAQPVTRRKTHRARPAAKAGKHAKAHKPHRRKAA